MYDKAEKDGRICNEFDKRCNEQTADGRKYTVFANTGGTLSPKQRQTSKLA
jgi:hypothetical protein